MTPIESLICAGMHGDRPPWPYGPDPERTREFLAECARHGTEGLLYRELATADWPAAVVGNLRQMAVQRAMWEMRHQQLLRDTIAAFAAAGLDAVVIKGSALAYSHYDDPALRMRSDTDLVIPECDRAKAHGVLETLGFRRQLGISGDFVSYQATYLMDVPGAGTHALDLHWKTNNSEVLSRALTYDDLRADASPLPSLGASALAPAPATSMLLACMHRLTHRHNPYYVDHIGHHDPNRLVWLYDIHLLASRFSVADWERFVVLAREKGLCGACADGLIESDRRFPIRGLQLWLPRLTTTPGHETASRYLASSKLRQGWLDFLALDSLGSRARLLSEVLFPPEEYMARRYGQTSRAALPWLYARRAAAGAAKFAERLPIALRCARFMRLAAHDKRLLLAAAADLGRCWIRLRLGFRASPAASGEAKASPRARAMALDEVAHMATIVNLAARQMPMRCSCLVRSLALMRMLQRHRVNAALRIGVELDRGFVRAHAWVEYQGTPVNDSASAIQRFSPFAQPVPLSAFGE